MKKIIINIGRQFGCGAKDVADAIGRRTGIPVYDSELLKKAAQDFGFSESLFSGSDEKKRCFSLSSIFNSNIFGCSSMNDDASLFAMQAEAIKNIARNGSAIIIGRAANYILRDCDCCLNVFLTSPIEERAKRVAERENMDREKALEHIERMEKEREAYYNTFTFGNWGMASTYDLCVDTSLLGVEGTADLILEFAKKTGKYEA
ncbi:MAG: cytidylate kinase-like family protein [Rikenellaceae bacterium]|nr:cytidylate kinase-like family protein [Rikenellaceae bacterium]MDY3893222.1 cytidylate kinase-like family protein [Candidatus Cryptobacteroides sp.]